MKYLLITLGHNSSAIFTEFDENGKQSKPIGYEEERLNKIKSSSAFPKMAIEKIMSLVDITGATVMISHWFDDFKLPLINTSKYYDANFMIDLTKRYDLRFMGLDDKFTHHDAHAYSAFAFLKNYATPDQLRSKTHTIVADGFGNNQEVLSIYENTDDGFLKLKTRVKGYENSLGLMYQFATSFCNMVENQDEYKFLGYEAKITNFLTGKTIDKLRMLASTKADYFISIIARSDDSNWDVERTGDLINMGDLNNARALFNSMFEGFVEVASEDVDFLIEMDFVRSVIGFSIQSVLELFFEKLIEMYNIENVSLAGGVFYNVKLNNHITKCVKGFVSINPLAGDQGAAIGMLSAIRGGFEFFDLCYGVRSLDVCNSELYEDPNILVFKDAESFTKEVSDLIASGKIVNIVNGDMEFGPRALCNTSTIFKPTHENVMYVNHVNGRNTIMPMAPVMLYQEAYKMFGSTFERTLGSNNFMVTTHDYIHGNEDSIFEQSINGALHKHPIFELYTARPQAINSLSEKPIAGILRSLRSGKEKIKCLVNTSFNTHGTPILYSVEDCIADFKKQRENDYSNRLYLVILSNDL